QWGDACDVRRDAHARNRLFVLPVYGDFHIAFADCDILAVSADQDGGQIIRSDRPRIPKESITTMLYIVIAYLWASICLYILLGGADFGAGIVELVSKPKHRKTVRNIMYDAIGPIWEANHMWLIIAIVILFVGFPEIYTTMSVYMHIPLVLMLLGIIARGTAFAFRHYDAVTDEMQTVYSHVFTLSSLITPFFLGIIEAATVSRTIDTEATDFLSAYVYSWLNPFGVSVGFFTVAICGYLAAVFAVGQTADAGHQRMLVRLARAFIAIAVACGG